VVADPEPGAAGHLGHRGLEVRLDLRRHGEVAHVAAGLADQVVVVVLGQVLGELVASELVGGDDPVDDPGALQHGQVPVDAALGQVPPSLERFSDRISTAPPIRDYGNFLSEFANSDWDVGICPLSAIPFNLYKADTKWVEYSSVGAAVVASRNTAYDKCCADGCGLLAEGTEEWLDALERVIENGDERVKMVERAQRKLEREYGESRLRSQVLDVIDKAHRVMARRPCTG